MDHGEAVERLTEMWKRLDRIADSQSYKLAVAKEKYLEKPHSKLRLNAVESLQKSWDETRADMLALHTARCALAEWSDK
jgi:DNA gyrase inhibitor GyrI